MPFGKYKDFEGCVRDNQDKKDPEAYCASLHKKITGKWPAEVKSMERGKGQGKGGERQGIGPTKYCKCTECGKKMRHLPNHPCTNYVCPRCGGELVGTDD